MLVYLNIKHNQSTYDLRPHSKVSADKAIDVKPRKADLIIELENK